ncbi:hypothetical protein ACFVWN_20410 [Nocardiopsis flavescens]|uniref:hypothetical protein n=1 Tax=Nocardiopsis flavescens TaxID=758803 RepID=UPI0036546A34
MRGAVNPYLEPLLIGLLTAVLVPRCYRWLARRIGTEEITLSRVVLLISLSYALFLLFTHTADSPTWSLSIALVSLSCFAEVRWYRATSKDPAAQDTH